MQVLRFLANPPAAPRDFEFRGSTSACRTVWQEEAKPYNLLGEAAREMAVTRRPIEVLELLAATGSMQPALRNDNNREATRNSVGGGEESAGQRKSPPAGNGRQFDRPRTLHGKSVASPILLADRSEAARDVAHTRGVRDL
jgi:hypothetical protein